MNATEQRAPELQWPEDYPRTPADEREPYPGDLSPTRKESFQSVVDELDIRYSEVNVQWQREHGEQLPKNERFYPAVIRAGLSGTSIEEELGLDE